MLEKEAKSKRCPLCVANAAMVMMQARASGVPSEDAAEIANASITCDGSLCMMWEPEYDEVLTKTEETPNMEDCRPDGEGWEFLKTVIHFPDGSKDGKLIGRGARLVVWRKYVVSDRGDCGLKSKENGCFAQCGV